MIDLHSHILPFTDDGARDWDESLEMLRQAQADGIQIVVATPHILGPADFDREAEIIERFEELKRRVTQAGIPLTLMLGGELYAQPDLDLARRIATLNNNKRYFLIEFPMEGIPAFVAQRFFEIIVDGKVPIIAHPERNLGFLRDPARAYDFVQRGALLQMNAGSLAGRFGEKVKKLATALMDHHLIHLVGSDGHDAGRRPVKLRKTYEAIAEQWGQDLAEELLVHNPRQILHGEVLSISEPVPFDRPKKSFLRNLPIVRQFRWG